MRKRMTSLLLTLVMLLSLVPAMGVTASAEETEWMTVNSFEELHTAVNNKQKNIKLGRDIDTSSLHDGLAMNTRDLLTFENQDFVLDLNGKTLHLEMKIANPCFIQVVRGSLTIQDSSPTKTGAITGLFGAVKGGWIDHLIFVGNKGSLTLEGGTFSVKGIPFSDVLNAVCCIDSSVTIKDGVKLSQPEHLGHGYNNHSYLDGQGYALYTEGNCKVIIDGGEFDGYVNLSGYQDTNGSVQINGGTFKQGVQVRYTAEENNSDPAVTVNGGTFEGNVYLQYWPWETSLYMPYRLNGGTFKGTVNLHTGYYSESIDKTDKPESNPNIVRGLDQCFGYNAVVTPGGTFTGPDASTAVLKKTASGESYKMLLEGNESNPVQIIPNAWGMMESVTLNGKPIDYAKDWNGTPVVIKNNEDHTITFKWKDLADKLKAEGYRYDAQCMRYTSGDTTIHADQIPTGTEYSFTIPKGKDPAVYSFDLRLDLKKGSNPVNTFANVHIVRLVVVEAPPAPPAPVAHSITITNTHGTANPTTAIAGETVTVKAKDWTGSNMMFTQWYTKTAGVTFADVTKQETTFVMPDRDVQVYPGYQQVSFTKQPVPQISLEQGYGGKTSFAFSWDISKWELVDTATNQTVSSDNTPVKAGKLTDVTIPANTDLGSKTYRIVVTTANGEQFKSNDFIVTWFEKMPAPLVEFSIPSGTKFIGELTVNVGCPSTLEAGGASPFKTCYTTNGVDPKDADPSDIQRYYGYTDVTLTKTTHFMARTILEGEGGNEDTWGELCEATYTMIDKLDAPTVTPESCSYSGSLPIIVTIQDVYNAKIECTIKQHDGYLGGDDTDGSMLETGLPDTFCGTTTFKAKAIVYKDGGGAWESDEVTYTYTREYWANISNATISGKVNKAIADTDVTITLDGEKFKDVAVGDDVSGWFNLPAGLTAKVKEQTSYSRELVITISGTPTATSAAAITVTIPKDKLLANGTADLIVLSNPKAVYNIGTDAAHTHDYTGQPYLYLDPGNHYQECKAGDGYNIQAHEFTPWTDNGNGTHSRHCTVCKMTDGSTYTETANHNWQWVVDTAATPNAPGKQHEECVDCHVKHSENTEIPMLTSIKVENLTVAKPVKDAAATAPTTTDSAYTVANTEWMAADGTPLAIGGKFQPGTVYTVKITLETAGAGVFSVKSTYNTIEGKTATVSPDLTGDNHADSVILTYTFDATEGTYVPTKPAITTVALPDGKVGDAYNQTLAATGTNPITWSIEVGDLPDGLTLVGDTIKGTPSKAGDFKFTVKATNGGGSDTKELTIKIADAEAAKYHNVTLTGAGTGATGAGSHAAGTTVNIYAGTKSGYTFNGWTSDDVTVLSASSKNASFVMPDKDVTVKANWVYNGGGSSGGGYTYYTIKATAGVNGSISPTGNVSVREGRDQTFTITPNKGYAVAKVLIDSKNVGAVKSYTFENVKKNHTIEVVFMKASGNPQTGVFVDVPEGSYYEEAVNWAVEKGITTGTDATHFSPDGICTRAQAVTFLWRAAGSPAAKSAVMPFTDVKAGSYYYDAVLWAVENGITKGTSDTMFSPDATCSRAQIITFLWRSQKSPAAGTANPFTDVKASAYYADAVLWAVKEDVTKGTTNTTFSPDANCTRAQIVTFIWRALAE